MHRAIPPVAPRSPEGATPAMAQWFVAKGQHPDAMIFFRMGDFFELFFEDAHKAADLLGLAVAHRGEHKGEPIPMAGVPAHALEGYLARLIRLGLRVAICDQRETPEQAKARKAPTIRREVVRLVTPGTVTEDALLDGARPAWLLALCPCEGEMGAAWVDLSTGAFRTESLPPAEVPALLARLEPAELLAPAALDDAPILAGWTERIAPVEPPRDPARMLSDFYGVAGMDGFGAFTPGELAAAAMALAYLRATQGEAAPRLRPPEPAGGATSLRMDAATRRSLEILRSERGDTRNCLLSAVDRTLTAAGARELAARLACPLAELAPIAARHDAVAWLLAEAPVRVGLRAQLKGAPDMARALGRLSLDRFAPRDLAGLREGLARAEAMAALLVEVGWGGKAGFVTKAGPLAEAGPSPKTRPLPGAAAASSPKPSPQIETVLPGAGLPALLALAADALLPEGSPRAELARALAEVLPARLEDGGIIAPGYDGELDALRRLRDDGRSAIAAMQLDLAQAWGVASLKIRHHQQFGYLAEMPAAAGEVLLRKPPAAGPMAPVHRQSMANAHRFTCAALAELDRKLAEAGQHAAKREALVVRHLRGLCLDAAGAIDAAAWAMAEFDLHAASAELAAGARWCRPEMVERADFRIRQGRHPVVEAALARDRLKASAFVPNDADLSPGQRLCLLTGPNMAGKSTFLRQNAIMAILAQAGLFVPAAEARIGIVDRLFSRVGAADDIAGGRSTFMVEMTETAAILNQATARSLVVLDEVGRGTATWDGLAIGWAVLETLHDRIRCRAIFATHFHELTALTGKLPELAPATMKVREHRGEVVFLHLVGPGASERSWGLHVAKLAGVPRDVVARATAVLAALEERARGLDPLSEEMPLFARAAPVVVPAPEGHSLRAMLDEIDPDTLTPRGALEALYRLKAAAEG